jgi:hypothetical protein
VAPRIALLLVLPLTLALAVDAGSVTVSRMEAAHDVELVGQEALSAVKGRPITSDTASTALRVAQREARHHDLRVQGRSFRLYGDGRLELTATSTAPTLLISHLPPLRHYTHVTGSATVTATPYS